jgi:hypothetical protein
MIEKDGINIKILYLAFHNSLKKVYGNRLVTKKILYMKLGRHSLVPKCLRELAIKEFEEMGLIKKEDRDLYKIIDYKLNLEEDANKFLQRINL